jgi:hypothetical protein
MAQDKVLDPFTEIGASGLQQFGGWVREEFVQDLQGQRGAKRYREMRDNSDVIGAGLRLLELTCKRATWTFEPAKENDSKASEYAQFLTECRDDMSMSWTDVLGEALTALQYGFAPLEIVYKKRNGQTPDEAVPDSKYSDGKIGWRKWALRGQDSVWRWDIQDDGGIAGMYQLPAPTYRQRYIPIDRMLLFRTSVEKNNPEGRSILRSAYFAYHFSKRFTELAGVGVERDLAGIPVGELPGECLPQSAPADKAAIATAMRKILETLRNHEQASVLLPSDRDEKGNRLYDIHLLSSAGAKQIDVVPLIKLFDLKCAMAMLTDVLLIGHEGSGSLALSGNRLQDLADSLNAVLDSIADVINRHGIPRLMKLNGFDLELAPALRHSKLGIPDLGGLAALIKVLVDSGVDVFPDEVLTTYLYGLAGLPTKGREQKAQEQDALPSAPEDDLLDEPGVPEADQKPEDPAEQKPGEAPPGKSTPPEKQPPAEHPPVAKSEPTHISIEQPAAVVIPAPEVNVAPASVTVQAAAPLVIPAPKVEIQAAAAPDVHVTVEQPAAKRMRRRVERDKDGRVTAIVDEPETDKEA